MALPNPLYTQDQFPPTSQAAMREFDDRYIGSIGATPAPTWSDVGDLIPTNGPMTTFPISSLALKYMQTEGGNRFKTLLEKSFDVKVQEFDCGIQGKLLDILSKSFAYRNWLKGPERMMIAEGNHRNDSIVALLEDGENQVWGGSTPVDGANFFSAAHLANMNDPDSTQWSNFQATPKDVLNIGNLAAEVTNMQGVLDENGKKIKADPDTILVPTAKYEGLKNLLAQALILAGGTSTSVTSAATSNPYFGGRFNVVHVPEFTDQDDWYLVDTKLKASSGLPPWLSMRWMIPNPELELRHYDASNSDWARDTGSIKVSSHIWYGFALAFPHAIRKIKGA